VSLGSGYVRVVVGPTNENSETELIDGDVWTLLPKSPNHVPESEENRKKALIKKAVDSTISEAEQFLAKKGEEK
jgi:hypothetical protein